MHKQVLIVFLILLGGQTLSASLQSAYPQTPGNISEQTVHADISISHGNSALRAYKDVFGQFGDNAERLYQQYDIFALEFLKEYKIEGLALLEKHGRELANLHPFLDYRDIFHLYSNPDNNINNLNIFSPETLSQFYKIFGDEGVQWIAGNPEI